MLVFLLSGMAESCIAAEIKFQLKTDGLPVPMVLESKGVKRSVTAVALRGTLDPRGDGAGTMAFDETSFTFNEFGDASKPDGTEAEPPKEFPVKFRRVNHELKDEDRLVFAIEFANGDLPGQFSAGRR